METDVVILLDHDKIMMDRTIVLVRGATHLVATETITKDTALGPVTIIWSHSSMGHRQPITTIEIAPTRACSEDSIGKEINHAMAYNSHHKSVRLSVCLSVSAL